MDSFMGIDKDMWNIGLKINKDEKDELRTKVTQIEAENAALRSALEKAAIESATAPSGYALGYKDGWEDRKYNDILEAENAALREALRELVEGIPYGGSDYCPICDCLKSKHANGCAWVKAQALLEAKP
jgi:hypothetical protein